MQEAPTISYHPNQTVAADKVRVQRQPGCRDIKTGKDVLRRSDIQYVMCVLGDVFTPTFEEL